MRTVAPVWAQGAAPRVPDTAVPVGNLTYNIVREGSNIGRHAMEIARDGARVSVSSKTSIAVRIMMITAYRFEQTSREVWQAGRLVEFSATTDDDGTKNQVAAVARNNALVLTIDGRTETIPATVMPASLWNPRLVQQSKLFDTADGRQLSVNVKFAGDETLAVRGANQPVRRFSITGDVQRDLWYDQNWTPVQAHMIRKDKSVIKFALT